MTSKLSTASTAAALLAAALLLPLAQPALAQGLSSGAAPIASPVPLPTALSLHARITALNPSTRAVTLKGASGQSVTVTAGPAVRLDLLKVGDVVNAKYYRSVAFAVAPPASAGGAAADDGSAELLARPVAAPGGEALRVTRISAIVVGLDVDDHTVDVVDPTGGAVTTIAVTDPKRIAMLSKLNIGDTVTAVVTQALAVTIDPAPRDLISGPRDGGKD